MKPNELMIGDWVLGPFNKPIQIDPYKWVLDAQEKGNEVVGFRFNDISPIPLTEEILLANGFKNCGSYEWNDGIYVTRYRYRNPDDRDAMFELNFSPFYDGFNILGIDVNHVHRLQQVLRLYGLNELADNFKLEGGSND